jgi:succinoglycan biosynthesis transport protein ExoP
MIISYSGVVRRRWWMLIGGLLVGLLAGGLINILLPRTYVSESTIFIAATDPNSQAGAAYEGNLLATQMTRSYVELLKSERVGGEVVRRLGPEYGLTADGVVKMISASSSPETVLIRISASATDPERAHVVAGTASTALIHLISQMEQPQEATRPRVEAKIAQAATVPTAPAFPMPLLNLALGGLFGLILGLGVAYACESTRRRSEPRNDFDTSTNGQAVAPREPMNRASTNASEPTG